MVWCRAIVTVVWLFSLQPVLAQSEFTIGGIGVGEAKNVLLERHKATQCYVKVEKSRVSYEICDLAGAGIQDPVLGQPIRIAFHIEANKIAVITISVARSDLSAIVSRLQKAYGPPRVIPSPTGKKKGLDAPAFEWSIGETQIYLDSLANDKGGYFVLALPKLRQ